MGLDDYFIGDAWRRQETIRSKPYEPPESPIDDFTDCVCIRVNRVWVPFLTGALDILINRALWSSNDPDYAPQEIIKLIEALSGVDNSMTCANPVTNITFEGGTIIIHRFDETTEVVSGSETIVTGVQSIGDGWGVEQGGSFTDVTGECGDCEQYPDKPALAGNADNLRACAIADGLVEYVMEKYQDFLDQADVLANAVDVVQSALKLVFPPSYILFAPAVELVKAFFDIGVASCRTFDTVEFREDFKEALYCYIKQNGYTLTASQWEDFRGNWVDSHAPAIPREYLHTIKSEAIEDQANKQSYNEAGECAAYDDSCPDDTGYYLDHFTDGLFGNRSYMVIAGIDGYYGDDGGIQNADGRTDAGCLYSTVPSGFSGKRSITVFVDLGANRTVTQAGFWIRAQRNGTPMGVNIAAFGADKVLVQHLINTTNNTSIAYAKKNWTGSVANIRYLRYGVVVDESTPATAPLLMDEIEATWEVPS